MTVPVTIQGPGFTPGPRALDMLTPAEIADLDPYMQLIVGYRKSGLSLNHIIGCPLNCGYCVRHFWGNFDMAIPRMLCSTEEAIERLIGHKAFVPHVTPLQIFNKATDPFLPGVRPHLFQVLRALDDRGYTNHFLIITRFKVTEEDMAFLESLNHLKVTLLFTYSGIADARIEPISKSTITVDSIRTAARARQRTGVILYWRPVVPGWNTSDAVMNQVLEIGRHVDAVVFTGYYHKEENASYLRELGVDVPFGDDYNARKTLSADIDTLVVDAWRRSGIQTPLFRKTSCGVGYAHGVADYNGHWGMQEICDICPAEQRELCATAHRAPTSAQVEQALADFDFDTPYTIDDGHVWTDLDGPDRYALQHRFGYQFWSINQPHFHGAHGRSLLGHDVDPAQAAEFAAVIADVRHAERYEDD